MKLNSLEAFLDDFCEEGLLDSQGTFTLDWSHALEKLGKYQSEAPGLWLLKLLQFAVSSGSKDFLVRFGLRSTRVQFTTNCSCKEVIAALSSLHPSTNPSLEHLQVGIQSLCTFLYCRISIRFLDPLSGFDCPLVQGVLDPQAREQKLPKSKGGLRMEIVRTYEQPSLLNYFKISGHQHDETLFLQEMGRFAPVALKVDGRLLNDPMVNKPPGLRLGVWFNAFEKRPRPATPYAFLERIVLTDEAASALALADHSLRSAKYLWIGNRVRKSKSASHAFCQQWVHEATPIAPPITEILDQRRPPYPHFSSRIERADGQLEIWPDYNTHLPAILARGYLSLDLNKGRPGRLYLVKDGVALKHKPLGPLYPNCLAIWSANHVKTDLSQLQVVEDEAYEEVLKEVLSHFKLAAEGLLFLTDRKDEKSFRGEVLTAARGIAKAKKSARN